MRIGFEQLDPRILPDMGVKVTFLASGRGGRRGRAGAARLLVPKAAVRRRRRDGRLRRRRTDRVERRAVKLGGTDGDRVEVLAGLTAGRARGRRRAAPTLKDGDRSHRCK